jgi:UDP-2,3-diacylglucosamine pyrophosphatase LpxH
MGFFFNIEQANIVGYLTTSNRRVPRLSTSELMRFAGVFTGMGVPVFSEVLMSSSPQWMDDVRNAADKIYYDLERGDSKDPIPEDELVARLAVLQRLLSDYNLFGLAVGDWQATIQLRAFINYAAISSKHHALFLVPRGWNPETDIQLRDPFPAVASLVRRVEDWPGVAFWTRSGASVFAPLEEAQDLYNRELLPVLAMPKQLDAALEKWKKCDERASILHLSDLHFGNDCAQEKEPYVSTHLADMAESIGRVVITGDLFDEPQREPARAFHSFRTSLENYRKQPAVVIPGNHDQKWRGNIRQDLKEMAKVEWSTVFVDDVMQCVFFCFDSSRDADCAKGKVTTEQRLQVATQFDKLSLQRPEIREYLRVALIHHHVFSFETLKETRVSRLLEKINVTDELMLRMDDSESFLAWCANRGVGLVMHGHKHVARYRQEWVQRSDGTAHSITAVGCGTTLGAEGKPLSYNLLAWDPKLRKWNVTYFMDPGDGSGFVPDYLSRGGVALA